MKPFCSEWLVKKATSHHDCCPMNEKRPADTKSRSACKCKELEKADEEAKKMDKDAAGEPASAPEKAPATTPSPAATTPAAPGMQSLDDADKNRPAPPPNPTGVPAQKPMPLSELLRILEAAGKSSIDAGLNVDKSVASLEKIKTMGGISDQERQIMAKSQEFSKKLADIKRDLASVSEALSAYRLGLTSGESKGWLNTK